jgi:Sodium/calcium exchanger protein
MIAAPFDLDQTSIVDRGLTYTALPTSTEHLTGKVRREWFLCGCHVMNIKSALNELCDNPILWLLILVPVVLIAAKLVPLAHTLLFVLSVLAIVPLAALLSHATESVAEKTGDTVGGLLNATLGNLTELVIAAAALRAGEYALVKGSIAGAIVTNTLFMLGASFLLGGLKHRVQEYNRASLPKEAPRLCRGGSRSLTFKAVVHR